MNDSSDQRCVRCGRRLHVRPAGVRPVAEVAAQKGSTAPAIHAVPPPAAAPPLAMAASAAAAPAPALGNVQTTMFREAAPKVVPIPTLTPMHPGNRDVTQRRTVPPARVAPKPRRTNESQQALSFPEEPVAPHADEAILCDAPVARPEHRLLAATVDSAIVLSGAAPILTVFLAFAEGLVFSRLNIALMAGMVGVVAILYRSLWCIAQRETPGMRFAGLKLVDFDGRRPKSNQRIIRQFAGMLSFLAAGVGLIWAFVDEESLTWHDHISKSFPTPQ